LGTMQLSETKGIEGFAERVDRSRRRDRETEETDRDMTGSPSETKGIERFAERVDRFRRKDRETERQEIHTHQRERQTDREIERQTER
jgi:putative protein kinase ArgK-like GTPase of G3E family